MAPRNSDHDLIEALQKLSKNSPKLVRSTTYAAPAEPHWTIHSWKMNEFKYYDVPSPFPTLARGLFTRWISEGKGHEGSGAGRYTIVARGYDKFFNIGEVPWTNWKALETYTAAPYSLTLKSNGCIIFMAALTPSKLIITSKHSLGPSEGQYKSHAEAGERWLLKHLEKAGKTTEELAQTLWDRDETAVAELCDDSFEEHVLPYSEEMTGLHLHGLNKRTGDFQTSDPHEVSAFAREWGFIPTAFISFNTVAEVREFTEKVSQSGKWNDEPIEGFVVRSHIASVPGAPASSSEVLNIDGEKNTGRSKRDRDGNRDAPPYPPGSSFFFKVKFDEPYMMYRDWREITKAVLSAKGGAEPRIAKAKLNRPETRLYKDWVTAEIKRDRKAFDGYTQNKGIIATRERFLKWCEEGGKDPLAGEPDLAERSFTKTFGPKAIVVPVAIPGCGKTSISVALTHLFDFGHTQSDDVKAKKPAPIFLKNVGQLLKKHDVVIADKNNHLAMHRSSLRDIVNKFSPPGRLVALNWSLDEPPAMIHRICTDRIQVRGENHQSLIPDARKNHETALWMFIEQTQGLAVQEVDDIIEMDVAESIEENLARAVDGLVRVLGLQRPSEERVKEALTIARTYAYQPGEKHDKGKGAGGDGGGGSRENNRNKTTTDELSVKKNALDTRRPRYFGILPEVDLDALVGGRVAELQDAHPAKKMWGALKARGRVTKRPHITLVHSAELPDEQELWDQCVALHRRATPPTFRFRLPEVVCNERVMAVCVEEVEVLAGEEDGDGGGGEKDDLEAGKDFAKQLPEKVRRRLHITVGTAGGHITPYEAKSLVEGWREGGGDGVASVKLNSRSQGRIKGLMY
ncbi:RNA ligase-domain-containing protein [Hysterangium stoloniferum]|nr:RNA ligase-domain-containing protein [Hysterangium stoloniferum]